MNKKYVEIAVGDDDAFFSISGASVDYDDNIKAYGWKIINDIKKAYQECCQMLEKLISKKVSPAHLTSSCLSYIYKLNIERSSNKPIPLKLYLELGVLKDKLSNKYSCCERKLEDSIIRNKKDTKTYDLYVLYRPCYRCSKMVKHFRTRNYYAWDSEQYLLLKNYIGNDMIHSFIIKS